MSKFLNALELSVRTHRILEREGIDNVDAFMALTTRDILKMSNAGRKTSNEVLDIQTYLRNGAKHRYTMEEIMEQVRIFNRMIASGPEDMAYRMTDNGTISVYRRLV
jgi:DNA-directed RNA polymerase alpha subunit